MRTKAEQLFTDIIRIARDRDCEDHGQMLVDLAYELNVDEATSERKDPKARALSTAVLNLGLAIRDPQ